MTGNDIAYFSLLETQRSNRAREADNIRQTDIKQADLDLKEAQFEYQKKKLSGGAAMSGAGRLISLIPNPAAKAIGTAISGVGDLISRAK